MYGIDDENGNSMNFSEEDRVKKKIKNLSFADFYSWGVSPLYKETFALS